MLSEGRSPVADAVFSKREATHMAAAAMTVVATLTVLLSTRLTLDDAYMIRFRTDSDRSPGLGSAGRPRGPRALSRTVPSPVIPTVRLGWLSKISLVNESLRA